jgi:hypothetical protein
LVGESAAVIVQEKDFHGVTPCDVRQRNSPRDDGVGRSAPPLSKKTGWGWSWVGRRTAE